MTAHEQALDWCHWLASRGVTINQDEMRAMFERGLRAESRTITLSENVRQELPVGFMVFAHEGFDVDYMIFPEEREARDYAMEQEEKANAAEDS